MSDSEKILLFEKCLLELKDSYDDCDDTSSLFIKVRLNMAGAVDDCVCLFDSIFKCNSITDLDSFHNEFDLCKHSLSFFD